MRELRISLLCLLLLGVTAKPTNVRKERQTVESFVLHNNHFYMRNFDDTVTPNSITYNSDAPITLIQTFFEYGTLGREGVILSARNKQTTLKIAVVGNKGNLEIGGDEPKKLSFVLSEKTPIHSLQLSIEDGGTIARLKVDKTEYESMAAANLNFTSIQFGAPPVEQGQTEIGITACFLDLHVGDDDILEMIQESNRKVSTSVPPRDCKDMDRGTVSGVQMYPAVDVSFPATRSVDGEEVNKETEQKVPQVNNEKEEEPVEEEAEKETEEVKIEKADEIKPQEPEHHSQPHVLETEPPQLAPQEAAHLFHLFKQSATSAPVACEKSQDFQCKNGASCHKKDDGIQCICKEGYAGTYCQFVILPRSCAEASQFFSLPNGPTKIAALANQPQSLSVVQCDSETTTLIHDMPNRTSVRNEHIPTHSKFIISYRDFSAEKIAALISRSQNCLQHVQYECNRGPLGFEDKRTWFTVASLQTRVSQIGNLPNSCPCIDMGCQGGGKCNCDSKAVQTDSGYLTGTNSGVIEMIALRTDGDVSGKTSLGPLKCSGFAGEDDAIRFTSSRPLTLDMWHGQSVSFQFRTGTADRVTLLSIREDVTSRDLTIELVEGHTINLKVGDVTIFVESQSRLNDTKWHMVLFEVLEGDIRLQVDSLNVFGTIDADVLPKAKIVLNDQLNGFVGCIRSVLVDNKFISLYNAAGGDHAFSHGCSDKCTSDFCRNSAECLEDFETGSPICRCKYPAIQSGKNCEIDINKDSEVSFHGGFLMFPKASSALEGKTLLSFKTDQSSALILFAHDENYNFIQLHLEEELNVTLSLNNEDTVYSCSIKARQGREFADMKWIQVSIDHTETGSTLTVEDDICTIHEKRSRSRSQIRMFKNWNQDLVNIPIGINPVNNDPYIHTFIGGVERAQEGNTNSHVLRPKYASHTPDLLGCLRGLQIEGEKLDMRSTDSGYVDRPDDKDLVRTGCAMCSEDLGCKNGGHCSVAWKDYTPETTKTSCDCSRTSYLGPQCTVDDGLLFDTITELEFDVESKVNKFVVDVKKPQTLQFAFSSDPSKFRHNMALITFENQDEFEVILNKNGTINVGIIRAEGGSNSVLTFQGNFSDGYRHFFSAKFFDREATAVMIDSVRVDFPLATYPSTNLDLYNAKKMIFGKREVENRISNQLQKKAFAGCLSNILIDFNVKSNLLRFQPISSLDNGDESVKTTPDNVYRGVCAAFKIPNSLPVFQNPVSYPEWYTTFDRQDYVYEEPPLEEEESNSWIWIVLLGIAMVVVLLLVCLGLYCCLCKTPKEREHPSSHEERQPFTIPFNPPNNRVNNNYSLPPADRSLDQLARIEVDLKKGSELPPLPPWQPAMKWAESPRSSWQSSKTAYFTAQEDLSDEDPDLDKTLCAPEGETTRPEEISGLTRNTPQRMSSFRRTDPTAPKDSPLYSEIANGRRIRPVVTPVPPPRTSPYNDHQNGF